MNAKSSAEIPNDSETEGPERTTFGAWWTLFVLSTFLVFANIDRHILAMLVQPIKADLKLSDTQISLVLGPAFTFSYAGLGLLAGWLSDRMSRRKLLYLGVTFWAASATLAGVTRSFLGLAFTRTGVAAGESVLAPAASSILADTFPRRRLSLALAIYSNAYPIGQALAFALGGWLLVNAGILVHNFGFGFLAEMGSWRLVLVLTGVPGLLLALLAFTFREPRRLGRSIAEGAHPLGAIAFLRQERRVMIPLVLGFSAISTVNSSLSAWLPAHLERHLGWTPAEFGPWLAGITIAAAVTLVFEGALIDRLYEKGMRDVHVRLFTWLLVAALPLFYILFAINDRTLFMLCYFLLQITTLHPMLFIAPAIQILSPREVRGQMMGLIMLSLVVLGELGPVMAGILTDYVFRDEQDLKYSLMIVISIAATFALVSLRIALRGVHSLLAAPGDVRST